MKHAPLILVLWSLIVVCVAAGENVYPLTNAPARIELRDQFDRVRALVFPSTNLTFLTIADKAGSEQIAAWVTPIKHRFGDAVAIEGIADVSAVPRPLRGLVRRKFQKAQPHSVMLDWSGDTIKAFAVSPDRANVFVLDHEGKILKRLTGKATDQTVEEVCAALDLALAEARKRVASQ